LAEESLADRTLTDSNAACAGLDCIAYIGLNAQALAAGDADAELLTHGGFFDWGGRSAGHCLAESARVGVLSLDRAGIGRSSSDRRDFVERREEASAEQAADPWGEIGGQIRHSESLKVARSTICIRIGELSVVEHAEMMWAQPTRACTDVRVRIFENEFDLSQVNFASGSVDPSWREFWQGGGDVGLRVLFYHLGSDNGVVRFGAAVSLELSQSAADVMVVDEC
jgi:hypothetical protein